MLEGHKNADDDDDNDNYEDDTSYDTAASTYWYEPVFSRPICTDAEELRQTINPGKMSPCFGLLHACVDRPQEVPQLPEA